MPGLLSEFPPDMKITCNSLNAKRIRKVEYQAKASQPLGRLLNFQYLAHSVCQSMEARKTTSPLSSFNSLFFEGSAIVWTPLAIPWTPLSVSKTIFLLSFFNSLFFKGSAIVRTPLAIPWTPLSVSQREKKIRRKVKCRL